MIEETKIDNNEKIQKKIFILIQKIFHHFKFDHDFITNK